MVVRKGSVADVEAIYALEQETFSIPWSREAVEKEFSNLSAIYFVAEEEEEEGKIIGYMGMWKVLDEGQITNVAVHKDYRRCGVASRLIESIKKWGQDQALEVLLLEVRASNDVAQNLYQKHGFYEVGKRKNYYTKPIEDAVLMTFNYK